MSSGLCSLLAWFTTSASPSPPLLPADVPTFLLANFKSVAEVKENFTPAKFSLVSNPAVYDALFGMSPIAATRIDHYPIHDVTGASAVIEFSLDADGQFTFTVIDNPEGIVTNSPGLAVQRQYAEQFQQQQLTQFGKLNGLVMTPGACFDTCWYSWGVHGMISVGPYGQHNQQKTRKLNQSVPSMQCSNLLSGVPNLICKPNH